MSITAIFECSACRFGVCSNGDHRRISASISDGTYGQPESPDLGTTEPKAKD